MRVAVLAAADDHGSPVGGASSFLRTILPYLAQRHAIALVGLDGMSFVSPPWLGEFCSGRLASRTVRSSVRVKSLNKAWLSRAALRSWSPSVVYAHSPELAAVARLVAPGRPCVLHLHGVVNPLTHSRFVWARRFVAPRIYDMMYREALRKSAAVLVSSSESDRDRLCERYDVPRERTTIVPTAVDTAIFFPPADIPAAPTRSPQFAAVCRLSRVKQLHLAIEAFARLKQTYPDATLVIAGNGEERPHLERRARSQVQDFSVRFLGEIDREAVARVLRGSVALLLPSATEGFPIAAIESLACGTPVVCTATGALAEIIRDGANGFFVDPASTDSFARVLGEAIERYPAMRQSCVESAHAFTMDRVGAMVDRTLTDLSLRKSRERPGRPQVSAHH